MIYGTHLLDVTIVLCLVVRGPCFVGSHFNTINKAIALSLSWSFSRFKLYAFPKLGCKENQFGKPRDYGCMSGSDQTGVPSVLNIAGCGSVAA